MITHDRYFLDRVTNRIIELDRGTLYSYPGNYTAFLEKKMERLLAELNCFDLERMWLTGDALPGRHEGQWINVILRRKR